jgi:hypothetical protein
MESYHDLLAFSVIQKSKEAKSYHNFALLFCASKQAVGLLKSCKGHPSAFLPSDNYKEKWLSI